MQEKFLNLSKAKKALIIVGVAILAIICFVGCVLVKTYLTAEWLEILLTCVGMFLSVIAVCLLLMILFKPTLTDDDEVVYKDQEDSKENK